MKLPASKGHVGPLSESSFSCLLDQHLSLIADIDQSAGCREIALTESEELCRITVMLLKPAQGSFAQFCAIYGRKHLYHFMVVLYHLIYTTVTEKWAENGYFGRTDAAFHRRISEVNA